MVRVFLQNPRIRRNFDVHFTYRKSEAYEIGMDKWLDWPSVRGTFRELRLPVSLVYKWGKRWRPFLALKYLAMLYEIAVLADIFRQERPDVLHVNNGGYPGATSCNSAAIAARIVRVPKITYMINSTVRDLWWERPITWLVRGGRTQFISASQRLRSSFLYKKRGPNGWHIIPNTVLCDTVVPRKEVRRQLGIEPDAFLFVVAGADEPRKGRDVFMKALFQVAKTCFKTNVQGWMSDPDDNKGFSDYDLIAASDAVVVPSLYDEDFPNVILIAMMYGRPVIASDVGGVCEMVDEQGTGILVNPGSVAQLYQEMSWMIEIGKGRREAMGEKAKERFRQNYSEDKVIKQYIALWKGGQDNDGKHI